jgi:hypothetical protein
MVGALVGNTADGVGEETLVAVLVGVKVASVDIVVTPEVGDSDGVNVTGLVEHAEAKQIATARHPWHMIKTK